MCNSLLTSATFFASTTILILGGLVAMLGTTDRVDVLHQREFQSRTLHALTGPSIVNRSLQLPADTFRELRVNARAA